MHINRIHHNRIIFWLLALCFPLVSVAVPPTSPENFRYAIYSDTAAELFWFRSTNVTVQGYELSKNGSTLGVFDALSYFDDSLVAGVEYTFSIVAVGLNGERSSASVISFQTPQYADTISTLQQETSNLNDEIDSLESLLDEGVRSPVAETGQTHSIVAGDDGDSRLGVSWPTPRFTVNVNTVDDLNGNGQCDSTEVCNGTVTDHLTGLIWLQNAGCFEPRSWQEALSVASRLTGNGESDCGLTDESVAGDWRVPNIKELLSLMDYRHTFPNALLPTGHPFNNVRIGGDFFTDGVFVAPRRYWTSTATSISGSGVYSVSFGTGHVDRLALGRFTEDVWLVRGGR